MEVVNVASLSPSHLRGLVDMGSNGIRFSITNLAPATARSLPVVYQERLGISLYDAQYSTSHGDKEPIPQNIIDEVLAGLKRFQQVCADFGVSESNIDVLATEATRNAVNSEDYRKQIKDATGWEVKLLPKEHEGRIGALGIASSFETVEGLVMDLGGGSTQLTWMFYENGIVTTSPQGSKSFPYGAAAMTKLLEKTKGEKHHKDAMKDLKAKIKQEYKEALDELALPQSLLQRMNNGTFTLYLSGGGFRGWGYILMSKAKKGPYPIPIINGYHVSVKDFGDVDDIQEQAEEEDIFRVSKRRASQVPAVAFLVNTILEAFPFITDVRFCQGGVREGFLFEGLSTETKALSPLASATSKYAVDADSSAHIASLLSAALPTNGSSLDRWVPETLTTSLIRALANTMYIQGNAAKESASVSAIYLPVTGVLAAVHGISHSDRALLALALNQRWEGDLPPPHDDFKARLQAILTNQESWWANYLGTVAGMVGSIYPAGRVAGDKRVELSCEWTDSMGKKGNQQGITLKARVKKGGIATKSIVDDHVEDIESMGKKKNRVGGKEYGFGLPVEVDVDWV